MSSLSPRSEAMIHGRHAMGPMAQLAHSLSKGLAPLSQKRNSDNDRPYVGKHRSTLPQGYKIHIYTNIKQVPILRWGMRCPFEPRHGFPVASQAFAHARTVLGNWRKFAHVYAQDQGAGPELCDLIQQGEVGFRYGRAKEANPLHKAELRAMYMDKETTRRSQNRTRALYGGQCDRSGKQGARPATARSWGDVVAVYRDSFGR